MREEKKFLALKIIVFTAAIISILLFGILLIKPKKEEIKKAQRNGEIILIKSDFSDSFKKYLGREIQADPKGIALATEMDYLIRSASSDLMNISGEFKFSLYIPGFGQSEDIIVWSIPADSLFAQKDSKENIEKWGKEAAEEFFQYLKKQEKYRNIIIRGSLNDPLFYICMRIAHMRIDTLG